MIYTVMPGQKLLRDCVKNVTKINTYTHKIQDIEKKSAWEYKCLSVWDVDFYIIIWHN